MEIALGKAEDGPRKLGRRERLALLALVLAFFALALTQRTTLVDPIDYRLTFASGVTFLGLGVWMSFRLSRSESPQPQWKRTLGLLSIPIFAIFIGTYLARVVVGIAAFGGIDAPFVNAEAHVTDIRHSRYGVYFASVSMGPETREFETKVSFDLYERLDPWRQPGRDCIVLPVQTGRGGLRRTMLPSILLDSPIGLDHYRNC